MRNRYQEFKEDGIFIQEKSAAYYIYKIVDRDDQEFVGLVAAASVEDYANNIIKNTKIPCRNVKSFLRII